MIGGEEKEHFIFSMSGEQHTKKEFTDCCSRSGNCEECGKPLHHQGEYGGLLESCESSYKDCSYGGVTQWV